MCIKRILDPVTCSLDNGSVKVFSDTTDLLQEAMSLDINAGYVMAFIALTGVDEQDPTDLSKVKVTYLGYTDFKTTKTITVDQIAATKMLTLATLTGESLFMSVLGTLFKDVPADVLSQLTVGAEYGISDIEDLTKCAVNTPVPAVCENGADGSYDGCRFKVGGTWDEHNTPLVVRMFYSDAALGGKPVNLVLIDFWDMYNSIASRFSTKPDTMRILFDTPSNKDGYNYSTVYVDMPYVTLSAE